MDQQVVDTTTHLIPFQSPDAGPSTFSVASISRRPRRRLPEIGYEILKAYCAKLPERPNAEQRRGILVHLHSVPGCEWYTDTNLARYFLEHDKHHARNASKVSGQAAASGKDHSPESSVKTMRTLAILFPSLSRADILAKLEMLLEDDPYPRPETVRIWSTQLDVAYGDVNGWLEWKRSRERACTSSQPGTRVGTAPLPTPEQSASPEPKPALASTQDNSIPHSYPLTPTSPTFKPSAAQIPTEPTVKTEDDPISIRVASLLLDAVNASRQPIINSSNAPKNCAMFERLQRPFEDTISRLHRRLCKQENAP